MIKIATGLISPESSLFGFQMATLSLRPHTGFLCEPLVSPSLLIRHQSYCIRTQLYVLI